MSWQIRTGTVSLPYAECGFLPLIDRLIAFCCSPKSSGKLPWAYKPTAASGNLLFFLNWKTFGEVYSKSSSLGRNILRLILESCFSSILHFAKWRLVTLHQPGVVFWSLELPITGSHYHILLWDQLLSCWCFQESRSTLFPALNQ